MQYRVSVYGPGVLAVSNGTGTYAECVSEAPRVARELQEEEGLRWCTWFVEPATCPPWPPEQEADPEENPIRRAF